MLAAVRNAPLSLLARGTWLPYGDLYHFAHSAVRWNYLPALERSLRGPDYRPHALLLGESAVLRRHRRALASAGEATVVAARKPGLPPKHRNLSSGASGALPKETRWGKKPHQAPPLPPTAPAHSRE
ncbi:hypothetical protein [Streptomyces sp. DSM 40750]|uniref:hypothetical protein n=1 Tax=Streptomyces sp. DSM 40750 TaxID=2801030 RepID=UPI00214B1FC6|nr:hypothetical protein [Streptomyces sp. DSM 40750]UUU28422.1 hypothetical protein JIX55_26630 [Streptomyces sp. DSM 40750]